MIIEGYDMIMTKGDSEHFTVDFFDGEDPYIVQSGDTVYFTVKENEYTEEIQIQKIITNFTGSEVAFSIEPEDTKNLKKKLFLYDVQLTKANGETITVIPPPNQISRFILGGEITYD